MSVILGAFGVGIEWASVAVERDGGKPLFCLPTKLALTPVQQADMLRRHVKEYPFTADSPAGLVLLKAYQDTFPCTPRT